jgi:hypothetical protein
MTGVDFDAAYALPADIRVVQRDPSTVQIGTEHPRRMLLQDAPAQATQVLAGLDGRSSAGEVVARFDGDPLVWRSVLAGMARAGLLVPGGRDGGASPLLLGERLALTHRHGQAKADRLLRARADAVVVVDGGGPVACAISALLAAAGIGHVHQQDAPRAAPARGAGRIPAGRHRAIHAAAWQAAPEVRVHRPAPQLPPSVAVLADERLPDLARAAELVAARVPHLPVWVTQARLVVGPLVLPGRSACLGCVERARTDADAGWPELGRALRAHPVPPAALPAQAAAELAAGQVLDLLDGRAQPDTVGGTLERLTGSHTVRRRSWQPHPDCGCRLLTDG